MIPSTTLKRVSGVFLLMILVCFPQSAGARNAVAASSDTISISKIFGDLNFSQILQSAENLFNEISDQITDDVKPTDLNIKLDFDFNIKDSQTFKLIQVIYNTLAGDDGMISQMKDREIKKFDEKTLNQMKKQFIRKSNKEIKRVCKGDRQAQKELKHKIKKLLDGIQIKDE